MEVDGATAAFLRVKVDLPELTERVRLDEVPLVVHVESVIDSMIFELGHVAGHVNDRHVVASVCAPGELPCPLVDGASMIALLNEAARQVGRALKDLSDWGLAGTRPGQYRSDLAADRVAVEVLTGAGFSVMSEESGLTEVASSPYLAVLDPVDGSTNASRGLAWFATSICVLDEEGPLAALVMNQATGRRYEATRGGGAQRDGLAIHPSQCRDLGRAVIGLSGYPSRYLGWKQYRALGAVALDLCAVADGTLDGYLDCGRNAHGGWDYLGGLLVCQEVGAGVVDGLGRELVVRGHGDRRAPVAAGTPELLEALVAARRSLEAG